MQPKKEMIESEGCVLLRIKVLIEMTVDYFSPLKSV